MDPLSMFLASQGVGALASGLQNLTQKSGKWEQQYTKDPGQRAAQGQILQHGLSQLQNPYEGFEPIANQARTQFETQTIPSIAERFTNMGAGAQRSSAFQGALGSAGAGLEQGLAALKSQYGFQNRQQALGMTGQGLENNFENIYKPGGESWLSSLFGGISRGASSLGQASIGKYMKAPIGSAAAKKAGKAAPQAVDMGPQSFIQQRQQLQQQQAQTAPDSLYNPAGIYNNSVAQYNPYGLDTGRQPLGMEGIATSLTPQAPSQFAQAQQALGARRQGLGYGLPQNRPF